MADTKISDLAAVTDVLATDEYVLARSGATKKIDASDLTTGIAALNPVDASDVAIVDTGSYYSGSNVEAALQEVAASVGAGGGSTDGWVADTATWTYASASTFTVTGDVTATFQKGTRLRFIQTTDKYAVVVASSHSAGTTTVTIAVNLDYTIANAAISATYYSYAASPQGYPGWFSFTPTYTGFSSAPSAGSMRYSVIGRQITITHAQNAGTSNATGFTMTIPVTAPQTVAITSVRVFNNGAFTAAAGLFAVTSGTAVADLYRDGSGLSWTASGAKTVGYSVTFEF